MSALVRLLCVTFASFALLSGCSPREDAAPPPPPKAVEAPAETLKLGFAAPLTGTQAHYGADIRNGLTLAVEEANAAGLTLGGKRVQFELLAEDDQADPAKGTVARSTR